MAKYDALVSFRTTREFKAQLAAQAKKARLSVSQLVVRVVVEYLEQRKDGPQA